MPERTLDDLESDRLRRVEELRLELSTILRRRFIESIMITAVICLIVLALAAVLDFPALIEVFK